MGQIPFDPFGRTSGADPPATGERRRVGHARHNFVAVVGESDYQETLRSILDRHGRVVQATLVRERLDSEDAIVVTIDEQRIGYLSPALGAKYGPVLRAMSEPLIVPAHLHGGEWDQQRIGVVLDFSVVYAAARQS